jgi:serine/threonine protein phosphatase PrpC
MDFNYRWHSFSGSNTIDNWDYCGTCAFNKYNLFILTDGATSSPQGGELAKELTLSIIEKFRKTNSNISKQLIISWLKEIHQALRLKYICDCTSYLIAIVTPEENLYTFHAGDCLLGRLIGNQKIEWQLSPHTQANYAGKVDPISISKDPYRNLLTRSFRGKSFIDPEFNCSAITPDDQLILATDGFWADLSVSNQLKLLEGNFEPNNEPDDVSYLVIQRKSNGNGSSVLSPENFFTGFGQ